MNMYLDFFWGKQVDFSQVDDNLNNRISSTILFIEQQLFNAKLGYPNVPIITDDKFERSFLALASDILGNKIEFKEKKSRLILTHDIDYIDISIQYLMKNLIGRRRLVSFNRSVFLDSLRDMLEFEKSLGLKSICFIPSSGSVKSNSLKSWLINPSYSLFSQKGESLKEILRDYNCTVGLHGGADFKLSNQLNNEINVLNQWWGKEISLNRQHWFDVSLNDFFEESFKCGIKTDYSAGWNGNLGFRGGFLRKFPIYTKFGLMTQQPLTVMDGILFDVLRLHHDDAFKISKKIIDIVIDAQGDIVLSWHGRTFSGNYKWGYTYQKILEYVLSRGVDF